MYLPDPRRECCPWAAVHYKCVGSCPDRIEQLVDLRVERSKFVSLDGRRTKTGGGVPQLREWCAVSRSYDFGTWFGKERSNGQPHDAISDQFRAVQQGADGQFAGSGGLVSRNGDVGGCESVSGECG
jgi:hypothetical protein